MMKSSILIVAISLFGLTQLSAQEAKVEGGGAAQAKNPLANMTAPNHNFRYSQE